MSIIMPSENEKEQSIQMIIENGLPQQKNLFSALLGLIKNIGFRRIFFGIESYLFLSCICAVAFAAVFALPMDDTHPFRYIGLFFVSPFFYFLLHGLTAWKELENETYEIKMTCHYTLRELTAIRMVFFGGFATILDVLFTGIVWCVPGNGMETLQLVGISLSALFLYGVATMTVLIRGWSFYKQFLVPAVWNLLCLLPLIFHINVEQMILRLPIGVVGIILTATIFCYLMQIKRYLCKGGYQYAIG